MSGYMLLSVLATSMGGFLYGFDTAATSGIRALPAFVQHIEHGSIAMDRLVALCFAVAATLASLFSGAISDCYGRRVSIITGTSTFIAGSGLTTAADNLAIFCVGRALTGIGLGLVFAAAPVYIAEVSSERLRGSLLVCMPFSVASGAIMAFMVNYLCGNMDGDIGWRIPLAIESSAAMLMLTGVMLMPRSPRWLLAQSHDKDASVAFCKLNNLHPERYRVIGEFDEMRVALLADRMDSTNAGLGGSHGGGSWRVLLSREARRPMLLVLALLVLQQPCELAASIYYFPGVLRAAGIESDKHVALLGTGGLGMMLLLVSGIGMLSVDRLGRRPLVVGGSSAMALALVLLAILAACRNTMPTSAAVSIAYAVMASVVVVAGAVSWRMAGWIYPVEILPNRMRARAMSFVCSLRWLFRLLTIQLAPWLLGHIGWGMYAALAAIYIVATLWAYHCLPETKDASLERIALQWSGEHACTAKYARK
ncbi:general substrate transporter [Syncephalis pseudoplumigaleata]|uniref:General substrate transporter n=1 Tax=Syncephalis pseudoplumigaleata TaxID=1712513 RepID=A0A4P9YV50_9FUNG|nr:general substrate transporter [Syncephalis pseudoplumigaleata]|eukprot:RKP23744.1 general substrate transporter [Syncephalis pseudoplumigaleata]